MTAARTFRINGQRALLSFALLLLAFTGGRVAAKGTAITLTSQKLTDENSLAEPTKIVPVTRTAQSFGKAFRYTFVPRSLTILRIKASP